MSLAGFPRALLALVLIVAGLAAQQSRPFDPDKDLPGYEAANLSEWSDLYAFGDFAAQDGKPLAPAEIDELRARWKAEQERAGKRIAAIQADPRERATWQLEKRLARHGYFSKIAYTIERLEPGIVMVLQRPAKDESGYAARIAAFYLPFAKKLGANFDALVAKPAGLVRREGFELTAFAVLASKGDLDNFVRFVQDPTGYTTGTCYDYQLQLAVTYEDPFASPAVVAQRSDLLYQLAKGLQHAHLAVAGNRPGSIWLYEGLAMLLALHEGTTPDSLDKRALRESSVGCIVEILGREAYAPLLLLPADELAALRSWEEYRKAVDAQVKRRAAEAPDRKLVARAYFAQCELWAHYLCDGAQGAYRKPWTEFQKAAFRGAGDAQDLQRAFVGLDLRNISRDFLRWVCAEHDRTQKDAKANTLPIDTLFDGAAATPTPASASSAAAAPAAATPLVPASFAPAMLAPDPDDAEAQLALALLQARSGDLEGARASLAALSPVPPWPERIARESARFSELEKLRAGYLAFLVAGGGKLAFKHKGKDVLAPIAGVENGIVTLKENKLGLPSIPLSSIEPYEIAKVAAKKEMQGEAQPWARFHAYAIAGDARWEKLLKDESPAAQELRTDAQDYPALLRTAQTARELFELSKLPLPREAAEAGTRLARIRALLASGAGSGLLERRIESLRQLATACLAVQGSAQGPASALHGKWTDIGEGRGKIVWEFDAPEEGQDWVQVPNYQKRDRAKMDKIRYAEADSKFESSKGALRGMGSTVYRLPLRFQGPVTLRYSFRYLEIEGAYVTPRFYWFLCDDGKESSYIAAPGGELYVEDLAHNDTRRKLLEDQARFDYDQDWKVEFAFDGKQLTTKLEGADRNLIPAGKLAGGYLGFCAHSELPIVIQRVEVEGRIDPASLSELDRGRIARELRALGFP